MAIVNLPCNIGREENDDGTVVINQL